MDAAEVKEEIPWVETQLLTLIMTHRKGKNEALKIKWFEYKAVLLLNLTGKFPLKKFKLNVKVFFFGFYILEFLIN